jgi:hypothetical protein
MGNGSGACGTGTLGRMSPENRSYLPGVSAALQRETRTLAVTRLQTAHVTSGWTNAGGSGGASSLSRTLAIGLEKRGMASKSCPGGSRLLDRILQLGFPTPGPPFASGHETKRISYKKQAYRLPSTLHVYSNNRRITLRLASAERLLSRLSRSRTPFCQRPHNGDRSKFPATATWYRTLFPAVRLQTRWGQIRNRNRRICSGLARWRGLHFQNVLKHGLGAGESTYRPFRRTVGDIYRVRWSIWDGFRHVGRWSGVAHPDTSQ